MEMRKITMPNWFIELPNHANLNAMDMKHLLGYSQKTEITQLIEDGSVPRPHDSVPGLNKGKGKPMWRKAILLKQIEFEN